MIVALVGWIAAVLCVLVAAGVAYQWLGLRRDARLWPPPGRMLDVGEGRSIHVHEQGAASPTVVLEAGVSASSLNWRRVQESIAAQTRAVAYDRAGLGWSDSAETPRTASNLAMELRAALREAGLDPPYVMVGHSFGGLVVRRYVSLFPEEVVGMVLVDPLQPDEWWPMTEDRRRRLSKATQLARRGALLARIGVVRFAVRLFIAGSRWLPQTISRSTSGPAAGVVDRLAREIGKMPREVWPVVAAHWCHPKSFLAMAAHFDALPESAEEVRCLEPASGMPVTVLTAGKGPGVPEESIRAIAGNARHIVAMESGHWIHLDQPELVVEAVLEMVETGRHAKRR
jgi:pimeloyl-ACP methyl ester carboxylesterase